MWPTQTDTDIENDTHRTPFFYSRSRLARLGDHEIAAGIDGKWPHPTQSYRATLPPWHPILSNKLQLSPLHINDSSEIKDDTWWLQLCNLFFTIIIHKLAMVNVGQKKDRTWQLSGSQAWQSIPSKGFFLILNTFLPILLANSASLNSTPGKFHYCCDGFHIHKNPTKNMKPRAFPSL